MSVKLMATHARVTALRAAGLPFPAPVEARALIDTGASSCLLDPNVISRLGLNVTGQVQVHTPTTGTAYETRNQYDVSLTLTDPTLDPAAGNETFVAGVIESHLASEGFLAIIGWDILAHCVLTCDGPAKTFRLKF